MQIFFIDWLWERRLLRAKYLKEIQISLFRQQYRKQILIVTSLNLFRKLRRRIAQSIPLASVY